MNSLGQVSHNEIEPGVLKDYNKKLNTNTQGSRCNNLKHDFFCFLSITLYETCDPWGRGCF